MHKNKHEVLATLNKKIIVLTVFDTVGAFCCGLGLYSIFAAQESSGGGFLPFLDDINVGYTFLAVGVVIVVGIGSVLIPAIIKKEKLNKELEQDAQK